jgi:hypothetical protein
MPPSTERPAGVGPPHLETRAESYRGREHVIDLPLPGLATIYLKPDRG